MGYRQIARYTEPFALLMGQLAYEGTEGPEVAYRFRVVQGLAYERHGAQVP